MKNTITSITLAVVLAFGATFANAGIIVTDRSSAGIIVTDRAETQCTSAKEGIIVTDFIGVLRAILGIIVTDRAETSNCTATGKDRGGIIVTDRFDGIIVTD